MQEPKRNAVRVSKLREVVFKTLNILNTRDGLSISAPLLQERADNLLQILTLYGLPLSHGPTPVEDDADL